MHPCYLVVCRGELLCELACKPLGVFDIDIVFRSMLSLPRMPLLGIATPCISVCVGCCSLPDRGDRVLGVLPIEMLRRSFDNCCRRPLSTDSVNTADAAVSVVAGSRASSDGLPFRVLPIDIDIDLRSWLSLVRMARLGVAMADSARLLTSVNGSANAASMSAGGGSTSGMSLALSPAYNIGPQQCEAATMLHAGPNGMGCNTHKIRDIMLCMGVCASGARRAATNGGFNIAS